MKTMNTIRTLAFSFALAGFGLAGVSVEAEAKPKQKHSMSVDDRMEWLEKKLDLTEAQVKELRPIIEQRHSEMQRLHEEMVQVFEDTDGEILDRLNAEQVRKYQDIKSKMSRKHGDRQKKKSERKERQ